MEDGYHLVCYYENFVLDPSYSVLVTIIARPFHQRLPSYIVRPVGDRCQFLHLPYNLPPVDTDRSASSHQAGFPQDAPLLKPQVRRHLPPSA